MNVALHIERLVLDGLPVSTAREHALVQAVLQTELTQLIAERGLRASASRVHASVAGGTIALAPEGTPAQLGRQVAHAVYGSLGGTPARPGSTR